MQDAKALCIETVPMMS